MKYAIYGINRVSKDFLYIFDKLEIAFFFDDKYEGDSFLSYKVVNFGKALSDRAKYDRIIVCDFDKSEKVKRLESAGMGYGTDYVCEEDFFETLDNFKLPTRDIYVWGIGNMGNMFANETREYIDIQGYIDSFRHTDTFNGKPVYVPNDISDWTDKFIVIAVVNDKDIVKALEERGLQMYIDYAGYQKVMGLPSRMLYKTIFDRNCYDLDCKTMLNHLEILNDGNTRCCCTTFMGQNLDNIFSDSCENVWKSNLHKVLCLSTENRTYTFCDKNMCPLFVAQKDSAAKYDLDKEYCRMTDNPKVLAIGYDYSCNLYCETCRKDFCFARNKERDELECITQVVLNDYIPSCEFLILAGNGEVFASPSYKKIYESYHCKPKYIRLLTNGTLFTQENWAGFIQGKSSKVMMTVSIDAATKETYQKIRRGGNFDALCRNMEFASELRRKGELAYLRFNFVVQKENYKEMVSFVQWGERLGVDEIFFTKILNWGTYTEEEFEDISMMEKDGITPKKELVEVIDCPTIKRSKIVDLGTIRYGHRIDEVGLVTNYYMWELEKRGGKLFV